jgi:hypothetical protein
MKRGQLSRRRMEAGEDRGPVFVKGMDRKQDKSVCNVQNEDWTFSGTEELQT